MDTTTSNSNQNNSEIWGKWIELQKLIKEEITLNEIGIILL